jgi:surfeit locus 1 family protein
MTSKQTSTSTQGRASQWTLYMAIPGVILLLALGSWQTYRLFWKIEVNDFRAEQSAGEPVPLPQTMANVADWQYRPVYVEGQFLHAGEIYLAARSFRRQVGYHIITPFEMTDGRTVLINRGWVIEKQKLPETRADGQIEGLTRVAGLVVLGQQDSWLKPENAPDENFWYWVDLPSISAAAGLPTQSYLIEADETANPGGLPIGGQTRLILRNEHLQYAIIWYLLAVGLVGITYMMRRGAGRPTDQSGDQQS